MTDTTKWIDKAVNEMMTFDEDTEKHSCNICGKLYKVPGTLARHIKNNHPKELSDELDCISKEHDQKRLKFEKEYFFKQIPHEIKNLKKQIDEVLQNIKADPYNPWYVESLFDHRRCETLIMAVEKIAVLEQLQKEINEAGNDFELILKEIERVVQVLTEEVINGFPEHNSTNELSNFHARIKKAAWADLVKKRFAYGFLGELQRNCKDIIKLQEKW